MSGVEALSAFRCVACGAGYPIREVRTACDACGALLDVVPTSRVRPHGAAWRTSSRRGGRRLSPGDARAERSGVWRFREHVFPALPERRSSRSRGSDASLRAGGAR